MAGRAAGTGETYRIPASLVVSCIGYRTAPIPDVPFDERAGRFANDEGRIMPGLYCVGWARRGPSGTIGTNRPDGSSVVEKIGEDIAAGVLGRADKPGREGFDALAAERGLEVVTFRDWKKIEEAEERAAREGAPREKFVDIEAMIRERAEFRPASASARKAPGFSRSRGSASARRHRRGAVRPCRRRSGRGCP